MKGSESERVTHYESVIGDFIFVFLCALLWLRILRDVIFIKGAKRASANVVGLMSGTSADGIDAVVARISGSGRSLHARIISHVHKSFPPELRKHILGVCLEGSVSEICSCIGAFRVVSRPISRRQNNSSPK